MTSTRLLRIVFCLAAVCMATPAAAQTVGDLRDGDCVVTVLGVPNTVDIHQIGIFIDGNLLTVRPAERHGTSVTLKLLAPVHENSSVAADLPPSVRTNAVTVAQARQQSEPPKTTCIDPPPP